MSIIRIFLSITLFAVLLLGLLDFLVLQRLIRRKLFHYQPRPSFLDRKFVWITLGLINLMGIIILIDGYVIEPNWIQVSRFTYSFSQIKGEPIRLVHLSDLHIEVEGKRELEIPEIVNGLKPDIIVITGDYLNEDEGESYLKRLLTELKSPSGVYAVEGNWDNKTSLSTVRKSGVKLLDNNKISLDIRGNRVNLYGISYNCGRVHDVLNRLGVDEGINIMLYHTPDIFPEVQDLGFDFYLCGHTHGGQVRLPFYGALITLSRFGKRYEMGWYHSGSLHMYVNRGWG